MGYEMDPKEKYELFKARENDVGFIEQVSDGVIPRVSFEKCIDGFVWAMTHSFLFETSYCLNSEEKILAFRKVIEDNSFLIADILTREDFKHLKEEGINIFEHPSKEIDGFTSLNVGDWHYVESLHNTLIEATLKEIEDYEKHFKQK